MEIYETINKNMDSFFANATQEDVVKLLDKHNIKYSISDERMSSEFYLQLIKTLSKKYEVPKYMIVDRFDSLGFSTISSDMIR